MDLSFSFDDATPVTLPHIDYATLLASVRASHGDAQQPGETLAQAASYPTLVADVVLGRPGWRAASLMLGGRFADVSPHAGTAIVAHDLRRKPV